MRFDLVAPCSSDAPLCSAASAEALLLGLDDGLLPVVGLGVAVDCGLGLGLGSGLGSGFGSGAGPVGAAPGFVFAELLWKRQPIEPPSGADCDDAPCVA